METRSSSSRRAYVVEYRIFYLWARSNIILGKMFSLLSSQNLGSVELHDGIHLIHRESVFSHICYPKIYYINNSLLWGASDRHCLQTRRHQRLSNNEHLYIIKLHRDTELYYHLFHIVGPTLLKLQIKPNYRTNQVHAWDPRRQLKQI